MTKRWRHICCAVLAICFSMTARAQTAATIVGDVHDATGAVAPNVTVKVTSQATGVVRTVTTNNEGQYRITPLNPGTYNVEIEAVGFKSQVRPDVVLPVAAVLEVDFTLEVGQVSERIEVTAAAPILRTEEASVGNVVTSQELQSLPVNQRNYTRLILLGAGTSSVSRSQNQGVAQSGTGLFSVNGGRPQDNNFTLDGFDSNMQMMNSPGISPPMDALQEFKVATNTGSEFGRSMGANVSMVIKSGSRDVHGTLYEYLRNSAFDANEFFANKSGLGVTPFRLNQYGVAIGGPVVLPKVNLRDKMFWFASWEGFRRRRGSAVLASVPPEAYRRGDFSSLLQGSSPTIIRDPVNGNAPFPNNIIPGNRINPAIPTALQLMVPLPNRSGDVQNLANNFSEANDRDSLHLRWDYNLNASNSFYFRYSLQNADLINPATIPTVTGASAFNVTNYGGSWTKIFSANTVLDVGFGSNQPDLPAVNTKDVSRADFLDRTGLRMYQREVFGDPLVNLSMGAYSIPTGGGGLQGDNIWQGRGNLSVTWGRHSLKFGGQYQYRQFYTNTSNPMNGDAIFNGQIAGFPLADALLGYPSEIRRGQGNTLTDAISHFTLAHVQDDWRVTSNLTINFGLMYQLGTRPYDSTDRLGNLWVRRNPTTGEYVGELLWATVNPEPDPVTGQRNTLPRTGGFGRALIQTDKNDFAPRLGIAYKLGSKTVVRSGFGMFYNSTFVQELQDLRKFWPFTVQQVFSPNRGVLDLQITDPGPSFESTAAIGGWPQNPENRSPYSMQWNFFIQQQVMDDLSLEIGYVGSGSRKQIGYSPFNNALTPGPGAINPRRLLPNFGDLDGGSNQYNGSYNGLQVLLIKRYSNGLQFNMNYTFQKSLDGQSSLSEVKVQDPFNRRADYSRSSWDINHVFNFAYVYELPFGRGRKFGGDMHRGVDALLGGWAVEGITRLETGPPIFITSGVDQANTGRSSQRPNLVGDPNAAPRTDEEWFNKAAFALPPLYTFGNAGQYITNTDSIIGIDMAVQKNFSITDRQRIEFRTEFFNLPNVVNFGDPVGAMNRNDFARISSQRTNPRQLQFGLRYRF